jgi:hypothetical protein
MFNSFLLYLHTNLTERYMVMDCVQLMHVGFASNFVKSLKAHKGLANEIFGSVVRWTLLRRLCKLVISLVMDVYAL